MTRNRDATRIFVAGHRGMVGSAIARQLAQDSSVEIITRCRDELDLTNQAQVQDFFAQKGIDQVYLAAAKVGGIHANNTYPAEFLYQNIMIEATVVHGAFEAGIKKLLYLGSSCIYPRDAEQPMREEALLSGRLEATNEPYAIAKIAGIKLCESYNRQWESHGIDYRSVMPTNLYGPGDNYHPDSHVIPALIRRFHEAKIAKDPSVVIWGSGAPRREFLYVDDLASACIRIMNLQQDLYRQSTEMACSHINVGSGVDITIEELALAIKRVVGFVGSLEFDQSRPDGSPRKLMSSQLANKLGWKPAVGLMDGLASTYNDFKANATIFPICLPKFVARVFLL